MIDQISVTRISILHPAVRESAMRVLELSDKVLDGRAKMRITQTLRTFKEQDAIYAQGRTTPGKIVSNAKAGSSFHNYGLAWDFVLLIDGKEISYDMGKDYNNDHQPDWMQVVKIAESEGWEWGGRWKSIKDYPHFQKTFGLSIATLLDRQERSYFIHDTQYVNL